ncbi:hypothetical protein R84981_002440 [Carnimonas sp. R-84981]|uniref:hypothetical protein n=1 Tax=Carnimonas bestiolae TaxID=3402172 RepID=UPI003EDBCDE6
MGAISILFLVIGETLVILSELMLPYYLAKDKIIVKKLGVTFCMSLVMSIAGAFLLLAFMYGYLNYESIWVVNVVSTSMVIIIEPVIAYCIYKNLPGRSTCKGLALAFIGLMVAITL